MIQVFKHEHLESFFGSTTGIDNALETIPLLGQDLVLTSSFRIQLGEDGVGLCLGIDSYAFGLGFGIDDGLGLFSFCRWIRPAGVTLVCLKLKLVRPVMSLR